MHLKSLPKEFVRHKRPFCCVIRDMRAKKASLSFISVKNAPIFFFYIIWLSDWMLLTWLCWSQKQYFPDMNQIHTVWNGRCMIHFRNHSLSVRLHITSNVAWLMSFWRRRKAHTRHAAVTDTRRFASISGSTAEDKLGLSGSLSANFTRSVKYSLRGAGSQHPLLWSSFPFSHHKSLYLHLMQYVLVIPYREVLQCSASSDTG